MKFDYIIGNPPYQESDGGGNGASAMPVYHTFIEQAKQLNPKCISMITPSRWFNGGKGLDQFRNEMLHDDRLCVIHDYLEASDCFSGVQIKGGVSYFLWDKDRHGDCKVYSHSSAEDVEPVIRPLLEEGCDTFIRFNEAVEFLHKVLDKHEPSMIEKVSSRMPFGLPNTYKGYKERKNATDVEIYVSGNEKEFKGNIAYAPMEDISRGIEFINVHKVFIGKAGSGSDSFPHMILSKPFYGKPGTACNESYLVIGPFDSKEQCENVISYIKTKFFRMLVLLKKSSQNAARGVYELVPQQDFSQKWNDDELYKKYNISDEEIDFINSMIKDM